MIHFGIDILLKQNPSWKKKRIGLVTNHAATTNKLIPSRKALLDKGFNIIKLFSPEHGLDVKGADGAKMKDGIDALTNLPVISLYNRKLAPAKKDLIDIDIILFDIPDIGCRCYTYLWTMTYVAEACAKHKKKLIILDRPNPVSGNLQLAEGPMLDEKKCASFIGRWDIPLRHSCTLGELALYFNQSKNIHADIEIIKCKNWKRDMFFTDWKISFVPTSPAIKNFEAMLLYPGLVLLEATNISEGRGTDFSFTSFAAPWLHVQKIKSLIDTNYAAVDYMPKESKYKNEVCFGYAFQPNKKTRSVLLGLDIIRKIKTHFPEHFKWKPYPTNVNPSGNNHLDKLLGIPRSEQLFNLSQKDFEQKVTSFIEVKDWKKRIKNFLLY